MQLFSRIIRLLRCHFCHLFTFESRFRLLTSQPFPRIVRPYLSQVGQLNTDLFSFKWSPLRLWRCEGLSPQSQTSFPSSSRPLSPAISSFRNLPCRCYQSHSSVALIARRQQGYVHPLIQSSYPLICARPIPWRRFAMYWSPIAWCRWTLTNKSLGLCWISSLAKQESGPPHANEAYLFVARDVQLIQTAIKIPPWLAFSFRRQRKCANHYQHTQERFRKSTKVH